MLEVVVNRSKENKGWTCQLIGPGGSVNLYQGTNADSAHDAFDEVSPILEASEFTKASARYVRLNDGEGVNWVTTLTVGEKTVCLMQFGKGGANKAADFYEEVQRILTQA